MQYCLTTSFFFFNSLDFTLYNRFVFKGIDLRDEGRVSEAFVFLNHYLDICEAIEDGESQLVDHTDFGQTDFPSNIPLPEHLYLQDNIQDHDNVREWVLAISMDQNVDQVKYLNLVLKKNILYCIT